MEEIIHKDVTEDLEGPSEAGYHFIQDWRRCEQYWAYAYYYGIEPLHTPPVLLYGIAMHEAMEAWYLSLMHGQPVHQRVKDAKLMFEASMVSMRDHYLYEDTFNDDMHKGLSTLEQYGMEYSKESYVVETTPDGRPAIEIGCKTELPTGDVFTGRIDLCVRGPQGTRYVVDHKTTGWAINSLERTLRVSNQATGYLWLWNENFPDMPANAVIFNVLRNSKGSIEFRQPVVHKTDEDIERFKADCTKTLNEIAVEVSRSVPHFTMNTDSCFKFNKPCPYLELCQGTNYELLLGTKFKLKGVPLNEKS